MSSSDPNGWLPAQVVQWLVDPDNWTGPDGAGVRLLQHLELTVVAVVVACLIALPVGLVLGHVDKGRVLVINLGNLGRAVPVFALLSILALGPLGLGNAATIVALTLFAIPPILTSTFTGIREVDPEVVEAARGMGLSSAQVLRSVKVPLARPLLLAGIRLSTLQVVATATIAALVAGGGLGRIITAGFGTQDYAELLAGAVLVATLAILLDVGFGLLARRVGRRTATRS